MQVQVARIGKPHGIRGEVTVQLMTDEPETRFIPGAVLLVEPESVGSLTVQSARWNKDILLLGFEEVADRNQAETLRGAKLFIDADENVDDDDEDAWYEHELVGLKARVASGSGFEEVGTVSALRLLPAQDLLVIDSGAGAEVLVPFVAAIVPEVNVAEGYVLLDPPGGLFDLSREDEADADGSTVSGSGPTDAGGSSDEPAPRSDR